MEETEKKKAMRQFVALWMELDERRRLRKKAQPIRQSEEMEELVRERAPYINDLIDVLKENSYAVALIVKVLEEARCFGTGERQIYPLMAEMEEAVERAQSSTPRFQSTIQQARLMLAQRRDVTLLACVKQTMQLEEQAIALGDQILDYIGLFEQLVLEDDDEGLQFFVRDTCQFYFKMKDLHEALLHHVKLYQELNKVYSPKKVMDYNRY